MAIHGTIRIVCDSAKDAERLQAAVGVDDDAFASTRREQATITVALRATSIRSLLRAIDDVLANSSVSEDLLKSPSFDDA